MINLTKDCVDILPCVETSWEKSENQTECLNVTNDQTCLSQSAANYDEIHSQTGLKEESGTTPDKDNIITIKSNYSQTIPNSYKSLSQANHEISNEDLGTGTKKMKEYIIIIIIIALLQIKKAIIFQTETEKNEK